uniref:Protein RMD5 homolog B-like n=2 Tax=Hirondellea gigas TaxID=1518452 RepID=A0A2P2I2N5_9CRUS
MMETDPRVPVIVEIDKVLDKFASFDKFRKTSLDNLEEKLQEYLDELDEVAANAPSDESISSGAPLLTSEQVSNMTAVLAQVKEVSSSISSKHRELHSVVSKVGKAIDKNFESSFDFMQPNVPFLREETRPMMLEIICNHLCREGMQDIAEQLMTDSHLTLSSEFTDTYKEVNRIVAGLRERNLKPAMEWMSNNRTQLQEKKSCLEFKLHRLAFICMLADSTQDISAAVEYARNNLTPFIRQHKQAIQHAMGALVFMRSGLEGTPYSDLLNPREWDDLLETFTRDACNVMGLAINSPLAVCMRAGCASLPVLLNIKQVLSETQVQNMWSGKEELPIELHMGEQRTYHSIFACPILRQLSTESNPPMRLTCGHVISKEALTKLIQANKVKCPYCPVEQTPLEPKQVIF